MADSKKYRSQATGWPANNFAGLGLSGLFLILFAISIITSTLLSQWTSQAVSGIMGRYLGTGSLLLCIGSYFLIAFTLKETRGLKLLFLAANLLVTVLCILNFWGIDPLLMYSNLTPEQYSFFLGTVGNKNVTSNYLCMVVSCQLVMFYFTKNKNSKALYAVLSVIGIYAGYAASSDSFLLGCAGAFLVLLWISAKEHCLRVRFLQTIFLFYISTWIMKLTLIVADVGNINAPFIREYPKDGLLGSILYIRILIAAGIILTAFSLTERNIGKNMDSKSAIRIRNWTFGLLSVTGICFLLLIICVNSETDFPYLRYLQEHLLLTDDFGSNRGYIWKRAWEVFYHSPLTEKLFGCGPACFFMKMSEEYGREMEVLYGAPFADAHNEFLQILITTGITGVIGYFGFFISSMLTMVRKADRDSASAIGATVILAFLFQGVVNNPQIFTTPILFAFLGIVSVYCN